MKRLMTEALFQFRSLDLLCECDLVGCSEAASGTHEHQTCNRTATELVTHPDHNHSAALCHGCSMAWQVDDRYKVLMDLVAMAAAALEDEDNG